MNVQDQEIVQSLLQHRCPEVALYPTKCTERSFRGGISSKHYNYKLQKTCDKTQDLLLRHNEDMDTGGTKTTGIILKQLSSSRTSA